MGPAGGDDDGDGFVVDDGYLSEDEGVRVAGEEGEEEEGDSAGLGTRGEWGGGKVLLARWRSDVIPLIHGRTCLPA